MCARRKLRFLLGIEIPWFPHALETDMKQFNSARRIYGGLIVIVMLLSSNAPSFTQAARFSSQSAATMIAQVPSTPCTTSEIEGNDNFVTATELGKATSNTCRAG